MILTRTEDYILLHNLQSLWLSISKPKYCSKINFPLKASWYQSLASIRCGARWLIHTTEWGSPCAVSRLLLRWVDVAEGLLCRAGFSNDGLVRCSLYVIMEEAQRSWKWIIRSEWEIVCVCAWKKWELACVCDYTVKGGNTLDLETCLTAAVPRRNGCTAGRQRSGCPLGFLATQ